MVSRRLRDGRGGSLLAPFCVSSFPVVARSALGHSLAELPSLSPCSFLALRSFPASALLLISVSFLLSPPPTRIGSNWSCGGDGLRRNAHLVG